MAWGYLTRYKTTNDENYKRKAIDCLEWLKANKAPGYKDYSWGKTHDFASRGGRQGKLNQLQYGQVSSVLRFLKRMK